MQRPAADLTLTGTHVVLTPLDDSGTSDGADADALFATCGDPEVFRWVFPYVMDSVADMRRCLDLARTERDRGTRLPLLQRLPDGTPVGSTSYLDIAPEHGRIEIGSTFLSRRHWRTAINTEAKLLLLGHAFDALGAERVALKTDHLNERSRAAIAGIGAQFEGILRHHMQRPDGSWRDTVYFSILADEWPNVRARLRARLAAHA